MTFAYGSEKFGMAKQIQEALLDERQEDFNKMTHYLAVQIWAALERVVVAAFGAMHWLTESAEAVVREQGVVEWVVPMTGFPARQEYWNQKRARVTTVLCGSAVKLSIWKNTTKPLVPKHKNSFPPNYIHSLDAAALMVTVVMAEAEGIQSFGMVHDCYSTHACDVPALAAATREAFITLYDGRDVADDLYQQFSLVTEVPAPPAKGTFDVHEVRESRYFFS